MANDTIINIPSAFTIRLISSVEPGPEHIPPTPIPGPIELSSIVALKCIRSPKMVVGRIVTNGTEAEVWYMSEVDNTVISRIFPIATLVKIG